MKIEPQGPGCTPQPAVPYRLYGDKQLRSDKVLLQRLFMMTMLGSNKTSVVVLKVLKQPTRRALAALLNSEGMLIGGESSTFLVCQGAPISLQQKRDINYHPLKISQ